MTAADGTIGRMIELYLDDVAKRCAASTVTHYAKRLKSIKRELGDTPLPRLPSVVGKDLVQRDTDALAFKEELRTVAERITAHLDAQSVWTRGTRTGQKKAPDTIRANVIAWEQLQAWMMAENHLTARITEKLKKPGGRKRELLPTKEETKKLLEHANDDFKQVYLAMRLTGSRPGELCKAKIKDLDRTAGEIILTEHKTSAKTGKPRRIAVGHESLIAILEKAIGDRTEGNIFLRSNGKPWKPEALTAAYRTAHKAAGLRPGLVLYLARHEHATMLYKELKDIKAVADALGHSSIVTTMRYTRVDGDALKQNQRRFDDSLD